MANGSAIVGGDAPIASRNRVRGHSGFHLSRFERDCSMSNRVLSSLPHRHYRRNGVVFWLSRLPGGAVTISLLDLPDAGVLTNAEMRFSIERTAQGEIRRCAAWRHERVAVAAYYMAESRTFEPGYELYDWTRAERKTDEIDEAQP
jgi:Protein of unknown function (DUF2934)